MVEGTPTGDALPPPPQRATPARKGARCGTGAGSPHPHRPHPGHTGRGTPAARSRGRAAGGGTAPDTRRPSQRWQVTPPGTAPHHRCGTQPPQGMQTKGTVLGRHTHTPAPTARGWRTRTARPVGGQFGERERLTTDAPHNGGRHPPGNALPPPPQRATPACEGARCGAGAGSHARTDRTRDTRVAEPRPPAPEGGRPGEGQHLTPDAPHNGGRPPLFEDGPPPPPRHAAPTGLAGQGDSVGPAHPHTRAHSTWVADPNSPPSGRAVGGGGAPDLRRPSQWWKARPPGMPFRHPHREQCRPARAHAVGLVLGPHARTDRTWDTRVAEPRLPAPEDGWPGEGQRLTPDALTTVAGHPPRGRPPTTPAARSPHRAFRPRGQCWAPTSTCPRPQHVGGRPQQPAQWAGCSGRCSARPQTPLTMVEGTPPGMPFRHPHSQQRRPAGAHAVGPVLGPHTRTDRTRDTRVAEPRLPAPEDGRPGEGQRLTPDAPQNSGRPPPPGRPPTTPTARSPHRACRPRGQCWAPTPKHPRPQHVGGRPQQPAQWTGSRGRGSA